MSNLHDKKQIDELMMLCNEPKHDINKKGDMIPNRQKDDAGPDQIVCTNQPYDIESPGSKSMESTSTTSLDEDDYIKLGGAESLFYFSRLFYAIYLYFAIMKNHKVPILILYSFSVICEILTDSFGNILMKLANLIHLAGFILLACISPLNEFPRLDSHYRRILIIAASLMVLGQLVIVIGVVRKGKMLIIAYIFGSFTSISYILVRIFGSIETSITENLFCSVPSSFNFFVEEFGANKSSVLAWSFISWHVTTFIHLLFLLLGLSKLDGTRTRPDLQSPDSPSSQDTPNPSTGCSSPSHGNQSISETINDPQDQMEPFILSPFLKVSAHEGELERDVYTMMMISKWELKDILGCTPHCCGKKKLILPCPNLSWAVGLFVFCVQFLLGIMIILELVTSDDTFMNIPIRVPQFVRVGQCITVILAVLSQRDLTGTIWNLKQLNYKKPQWRKVVKGDSDTSFNTWVGCILLPNFLKIMQGLLILAASIIVIIQSDSLVKLLTEFAALFVVSTIDDTLFSAMRRGYFGSGLLKCTSKVKSLKIEKEHDNLKAPQCMLYLLLVLLLTCWAFVTFFQSKGVFFEEAFPDCKMNASDPIYQNTPLFTFIKNGTCDFPRGVGLNIEVCGYEGGDC